MQEWAKIHLLVLPAGHQERVLSSRYKFFVGCTVGINSLDARTIVQEIKYVWKILKFKLSKH